MTSRPRSRSPTSRPRTRVVFSVDPSTTRQRMLGPVDADAQRDHAQMVGEMDPVDHDRHQVQPGQVRGQQVGQRGLGRRHELPRHRRLAGRRRVGLDLLADRLQRDRVAAGRHPGQHPLHRHPAEQLGGGEQLIGRHRHLAGAVAARTRGRVTGTRRPPRVTEPASLPCRVAVRAGSCLPRGPQTAVTSASISCCITCSPAPTARASSPSRSSAAISPIATLTWSGTVSALVSSAVLW